jgi:hypothetical protein
MKNLETAVSRQAVALREPLRLPTVTHCELQIAYRHNVLLALNIISVLLRKK